MNFDKNNVGIIGYWFATNYGGVASYYSLYKTIEQLGYLPFLVETPYLKTDKEGEDVFSRNFFRQIDARISECYEADKLNGLNELSNTFLLGSDQVLTASSIKYFGKLFLMEFAEAQKKLIAFSASCGGDKLEVDNSTILYAKNLLSRFANISVREYSAVDLVKEKFNVDAKLMIDPIFLNDSDDYKEVAKLSGRDKEENEYVFAYILDPTPDKRLGIYEVAAQLGIGKKVALDGRKFTHENNCVALGMENVTLPELNLTEWLHYFTNASFIFTDSFHGAAMAIILNKPFVMYANFKRGYPRFVTLAEMFNLKSRLVTKASEITAELIKTPINYENVNALVQKYKENAVQWLKSSLNENQEHISESLNEVAVPPPIIYKSDGPYYSTETYKSKQAEEYSVCPKIKCTGCGACSNICPQNCITMIQDNEGFSYPQIDNLKCTKCMVCEKKCPSLNRQANNSKIPLDVYAAFSLDSDTRYQSTSGGAFSEFAKYVFRMSGVCYGAAYDENFHVNHVRIASEDQLPVIRQSKYLQSNINDTFKNVKKDLEHGLYVMFCGAPCQCAGLLSFLNKEYKRLIVVDFICHSICSPKAFDYYLKDIEIKHGAKASRVWFKNKETTWKNFSLRIDFENKEEYYRQTCTKDAYFEAFLKYRVCSRPSCHACQFKGVDRAADITLADFWGLKWKNQQYGEEQTKNGVSLIILNSQKGKNIFDLFTKYRMYTEKHTLEDAIAGNGGYYNSQRVGLYRDYFFENLEQIPFGELIQSMRSREEKIHSEKK